MGYDKVDCWSDGSLISVNREATPADARPMRHSSLRLFLPAWGNGDGTSFYLCVLVPSWPSVQSWYMKSDSNSREVPCADIDWVASVTGVLLSAVCRATCSEADWVESPMVVRSTRVSERGSLCVIVSALSTRPLRVGCSSHPKIRRITVIVARAIFPVHLDKRLGGTWIPNSRNAIRRSPSTRYDTTNEATIVVIIMPTKVTVPFTNGLGGP